MPAPSANAEVKPKSTARDADEVAKAGINLVPAPSANAEVKPKSTARDADEVAKAGINLVPAPSANAEVKPKSTARDADEVAKAGINLVPAPSAGVEVKHKMPTVTWSDEVASSVARRVVELRDSDDDSEEYDDFEVYVSEKLQAPGTVPAEEYDVQASEERPRPTSRKKSGRAHRAKPSAVDEDTVDYEDLPSTVELPITMEMDGRQLASDSMCQHHITGDRTLFDDGQLHEGIEFRLRGYNGDKVTPYKYHGYSSKFGRMIYVPGAPRTLLCYADMDTLWHTSWARNGQSCLFTLRRDHSLRMMFRIQDKLLTYVGAKSASAQRLRANPDVTCAAVDGIEQWSASEYKSALQVVKFHYANGHASQSFVESAVRHGLLRGIPFTLSDVARGFALLGRCTACDVGKAQRRHYHPPGTEAKPQAPQPPPVVTEDTAADEAPHQDSLGLDIMYIDGHAYLVTVSKRRKYLHVIRLAGKSEGDIQAALKVIIQDYKRHRADLIHLFNARSSVPFPEDADNPIHGFERAESDGEPGIIALALSTFASEGIRLTPKVSGEHVGYVEKVIDTVKDRVACVRSTLSYAVTGTILHHLVTDVVTWMNLLPMGGRAVSAHMLLTGTAPRYSDVMRCQFGDVIVATRQKKDLKKGMPAGELGLAVGISLTAPGAIRFYSFSSMTVKPRTRITVSNTVDLCPLFGENKHCNPPPALHATLRAYHKAQHPEKDEGDDVPVQSQSVGISANGEVSLSTLRHVLDQGSDARILLDQMNATDPSSELDQYDYRYEDAIAEALADDDPDLENTSCHGGLSSAAAAAISSKVREMDELGLHCQTVPARQLGEQAAIAATRPRATRQSSRQRASTYQHDYAPLRQYQSNMVDVDGVDVDCASTSWKRGERDHPQKGAEAIEKELRQIFITYEVCHPVDVQPKDVVYCRSHDLFDVKLADDSCKGRLVVGAPVGGKEINYGIDLYSPTIDLRLISTMLSICVEQGLELSVWDVKGAFLKSPMKMPGVYVLLEKHIVDRLLALDGIPEHWRDFVRPDGTMMVECDKAWYGTSAACALWNEDVNRTIVEECGYTRHSLVPCLYYKDLENGQKAYLMLYVDDIGAMMPADGQEKVRVLNILENKYESLKKQDGDYVKYVGLEVTRNRELNRFEVTMAKRTKKLAASYGVTSTVPNPTESSVCFVDDDDDHLFNMVDTTAYRSLVMSLRYLTMAMPECLFHTSYLASKQGRPTEKHWAAAIHVLKYMLGACETPMCYGACGPEPRLDVYTDASFRTHSDTKSHSGKVIFLGTCGGSIFSASGKQHCVTSSTCDSEMIPFEECTYMASYLRDVLIELGVKVQMVIHWEDNTSCLHLTKHGTREYAKKRKHIISKIYSAKEYFDDPDNDATALHCRTEEMIADILTKDLHGAIFVKHRRALHGT